MWEPNPVSRRTGGMRGEYWLTEVFLVLLLPGVVVLFWPKWGWSVLMAVAIGVVASHLAYEHFNERAIQATLDAIDAKLERGETLEEWERMYDGTGDRAAASLVGFIYGVVSAGIALPIRYTVYRWRRSRSR